MVKAEEATWYIYTVDIYLYFHILIPDSLKTALLTILFSLLIYKSLFGN